MFRAAASSSATHSGLTVACSISMVSITDSLPGSSVSRRPSATGQVDDTPKRGNVTMDDQQLLAEQFEQHRTHLRAVAYRMLGSITEADDAVQEAWLRLSRSDADTIENLGGWLTTVVSRVCLNVLRSRTTRREDPLDPHVPDPIVRVEGTLDPEEEAMLADAVGVALARGARDAHPRGAVGVRAARHVRGAVRPGGRGARPFPRGDPAVRQPGPTARTRRHRRHPTPTSPASERRSTRSSPPPGPATSRGWSRCSTPTSSPGPTAGADAQSSRRSRAARPRSPVRR